MLHVIWHIIVGFVVGLVARAVMPGAQSMGLIKTTLLGIVGGVVGGLIGAALFQTRTGLGLSSRRVHHVSHRRRYCPLSLDAIGAGRVVLETKIRDFTNDGEVRELVRAFEEATVLPSQFHHCAHIAVALTYLAEALAR